MSGKIYDVRISDVRTHFFVFSKI